MPEIAGKYLSLTSFKRDGTAVATPVWFVADRGRLLVEIEGDSGKAKRIRRNPSVLVAPCGPSGRLRGNQVRGRAVLLPPEEHERAQQLLARKYRFDRVVALPLYRIGRRLGGRPVDRSALAFLAITPE